MGTQAIATDSRPRRLARSIGAVVAGFLTVVILSLGTDEVLHVINVYPPWGQPMHDPSLNVLGHDVEERSIDDLFAQGVKFCLAV